MSMLFRIVHHGVRSLLYLCGFFLIAGGAAAFALYLPLGILPPSDLGEVLGLLLEFIRNMGVTFILAGGTVAVLLHRARRDPPSVGSEDAGVEEERHRLWNFASVSFALLPLLTIPAMSALITWWSEGVSILGQWGVWEKLHHQGGEYSGLAAAPVFVVLLVPFLELAAIGTFLLTTMLMLPLLLKRNRRMLTFLAVCLAIQSAFVFGSGFAVTLMTDTLSLPPANGHALMSADGGLIKWIDRHELVGRPAMRSLIMVFVGYAAWLPIFFFRRSAVSLPPRARENAPIPHRFE